MEKIELTLFTIGFFGLSRHGYIQGEIVQGTPSLKISKTKNYLTLKLSSQKHVSFVSIVYLFGLRQVMLLWRHFFDQPPANFVSQTNNSNCSPKIIWNRLHWCNPFILSQSLLYLKQTSKQKKKAVNNQSIQFLFEKLGY